MTQRAPHLWLLFFGGCSKDCPPLSSVPVRGGTETEAAALQDELDEMGEEPLAAPVCINHVRIGGFIGQRAGGVYNSTTHGVRIRPQDPSVGWVLDELRVTLRHEICHGIDLQNDLVRDREDLFVYPYPPDVTDARIPNEAFADTCERGPVALYALPAADCPEDPDLRAATIVRDEAFGLGLPTIAARYEPIAQVEADLAAGDIYSLNLRAAEEGGISVSIQGNGIGARMQVDPFSGEVLDTNLWENSYPEAFPPEVPPAWSSYNALGGMMSDGTGVVLAELWLPTGSVWRYHALVEGEWVAADGPCPNDTTIFFHVEDELWMGQLEGDSLSGYTVSWGRWVREQ